MFFCFYFSIVNAQKVRKNFAIQYFTFNSENDTLLSETHKYEFDLKGNEISMLILSKKDTNRKILNYYDNLNRKIKVNIFGQNNNGKLGFRYTEILKYDLTGNIIEFKRIPLEKNNYLNQPFISEKYVYNLRNKLVFKSRCEGDNNKICKNDSLFYDKNNVLVKELNENSKTTYEYDSMGNKKLELYFGYNLVKSAKMEYAYDKKNQKTSFTMYDYLQLNDSWQERVRDEYEYDGLGNIVKEINFVWDYGLSLWKAKFKSEFIFNLQNEIIKRFWYINDLDEGIKWKIRQKGYYLYLN